MNLANSCHYSDAELLAHDLFCNCDAGRAARLLAERRQSDWQSWQKVTEKDRAAHVAQSKAISGSPIPFTLESVSLKMLRHKARLQDGSVDPEKKLAIDLADTLRESGEISLKDERRKNSMLVYGTPGVGKTGCLLPVLYECQRKGKDTFFVDFKHLMRMVRDGYKPLPGQPTAAQVINRACDVEVLYLDDIGHTWESEIKAHSVQIMGDIVRFRHAKKSCTLMTSNLEPNALAAQITSEIYQRIAEMAVVVKMGGKLLRQLI